MSSHSGSTRQAAATGAQSKAARAERAAQKAAATAHAERQARQQARHTVRALERLVATRTRNPNAYQGARRLVSHLPPRVQRELDRQAQSIAGLGHERFIATHAATGGTLLTKNGRVGSHAVSTTAAQDRYLHTLAGQYVDLHNHPFGEGNYPTFSDTDYQRVYQTFRPSEARVVTERGIASLRPRTPGANWPSYGRTVRPALDRHYNAIQARLATEVRSGKAPRGTFNLTAGDIMHLAWRRAARETGLVYQRVPLHGGGGRNRKRAG